MSWRIYNFKGSNHMTRLITGHHFLNSFQAKVNPTRISRNCSCGQVETLNHYLFLCQKYIRFRKKWQYKVVSITEDIGALSVMSLATAFGQRLDLTEEQNMKLQESICTYIVQTERFVWTTHNNVHKTHNMNKKWSLMGITEVPLARDFRTLSEMCYYSIFFLSLPRTVSVRVRKRYIADHQAEMSVNPAAIGITNNWVSCWNRDPQAQNNTTFFILKKKILVLGLFLVHSTDWDHIGQTIRGLDEGGIR